MNTKIKILLSVVTFAILTACGDCESVETGAAVIAPVATVGSTPPPQQPVPVITTTESDTVCPQTTSCEPTPTPSPIRPIIVTPSPTPVCVRDESITLVLINEVLTDNCGNKYGKVST